MAEQGVQNGAAPGPSMRPRWSAMGRGLGPCWGAGAAEGAPRGVRWRRGAACGRAWAKRGAVVGRSGCGKGAACGCAGAQCGTAHARCVGPRWGIVAAERAAWGMGALLDGR